MSAPLPFTVHVPFVTLALPAAPTAPMSAWLHPAGSAPPPPPPPDRMLNRPESPVALAFSESVAVTRTRACSLAGPGLFHWHDVAEPPRFEHSAIGVQCAPSSDEEATSIRASGEPLRDLAIHVLVSGESVVTTAPAAGAVTDTVGGATKV